MTLPGIPRRVDVVIVGGGLAGVAAALSLARLGATAVIVDRSLVRPVLGESMPPGARPVLERLGVWDTFLADGHRPAYGNRSTWGSEIPAESDFVRSPYGNGWHIDRDRVDRMLDSAVGCAGISVVSETRVLACERSQAMSWCLTLQTGRAVTQLGTDFVVDATGRARQITRMLGVPRHTFDRLVGFVGVLASGFENRDTDTFTEIEATCDGWWYVSVLPDSRLVAGYMTDAHSVTAQIARHDEGWTALLRQTSQLRDRVERHGYRLQSHIHCVAAYGARLERVTGDGFCAVGDAAAAYDPLSSQGINSALTSGVWAAEAIATTEQGGLVEYEARMRRLYADYLAQWLGYYSLEKRWPDSDFWSYRHRLLTTVLSG